MERYYKNRSKVIIDALWNKVRFGKEWKERFGHDADSVMASLRNNNNIH